VARKRSTQSSTGEVIFDPVAGKGLTGLSVQKSEEEWNGATEKKRVRAPDSVEDCAFFVRMLFSYLGASK
jgi:hypothetical protein